jgi:hypothetical protein
MTDQEAVMYLNDEARTPRVRARSKDLDEYAGNGAYYDSTVLNGALGYRGIGLLISLAFIRIFF